MEVFESSQIRGLLSDAVMVGRVTGEAKPQKEVEEATWQLQAMEGSTSSTPGEGWGYSVRGSYLVSEECTPAQ